jgi:hypothetical protein
MAGNGPSPCGFVNFPVNLTRSPLASFVVPWNERTSAPNAEDPMSHVATNIMVTKFQMPKLLFFVILIIIIVPSFFVLKI